MDEAVGVVRFRPAPDFDRLKAIMHEDPREVIAQGKHFLTHTQLDRLTQARTYNLLCYTAACVLKRSTVEAAYHGHEAVELARSMEGIEAKAVLFDSLVNFGTASERTGEYERAVNAYREALAMPLEWIGRRHHEEAVITYLGRALYYKGDYQDALAAFDQASGLARLRQDPYAEESLHSMRGMCYLRLGDMEAAQRFTAQAASVTNDETRYELRPKGRILGNMAIVAFMRGELPQAQTYANAVLDIAREIEDPHGLVDGNIVLALCHQANRRVEQATELAAEASRVAFEYGYVPLIQDMAWLLTHLYLQRRGSC